MDKVLRVLEPVKISYQNLSWADLIVLAGTIALEEASGVKYEFCGGRSDALDGSGSSFLNNMTLCLPIYFQFFQQSTFF